MGYTLVTLLTAFVATPLLLRWLGNERLGAYRVIMDWTGYASVLDFGVGPALSVLMLRAFTLGQIELRAAIRRGFRLLTQFTPLVFGAGLLIAASMPRLVRVPDALRGEVRIAAFVATAGLLLQPTGVFRTVLDATQRGYVVNVALLFQSVVITGTSLLFAWLGWGLVGQTAGSALGLLTFAAFTAWRAWPEGGLRSARTAAEVPSGDVAVTRLAWPLWLAQLVNRVSLMTDTIVVGLIFGAGQVTTFYLTQRLIQLAGGQVNGISNASWAGLVELSNRGDRAAFEIRCSEVVRLLVALGLTLTGTAAVLNARFVGLWVGAEHYGGTLLGVATCGATVVAGFVTLFNFIIDAHGDAKARIGVSVVGGVANLGLSVALARPFGVAGIALGTLIGYLLTDAWYGPLVIAPRYGLRRRMLLAAVGRGLAFGVPFPLAAAAVIGLLPEMRWPGLLGTGVITGTAALAYCWLFVLTPSDRDAWRRRAAAFVFSRRRGA